MSQTVRAGTKQVARRSRLPWIAWLVGVLTVAAWFVLFHSSWFLVANVKVFGATRLDSAVVSKQAQLEIGQPLISIQSNEIEKALRKIPEVKSVRVERGWPHTILITVIERYPVAVASTSKGFQLVDDLGSAAGPIVATAPKQLLVIQGRPNTPAMLSAVQIVAALPTQWKVQSMVASTQDLVVVRIAGGVEVTFGSGERALDKVKVAQALMANNYTAINVSAPDAPTVR
ncbi:MAG: FtsQ-type POTRA domain-containing protein [Actinomycetes bacterium]